MFKYNLAMQQALFESELGAQLGTSEELITLLFDNHNGASPDDGTSRRGDCFFDAIYRMIRTGGVGEAGYVQGIGTPQRPRNADHVRQSGLRKLREMFEQENSPSGTLHAVSWLWPAPPQFLNLLLPLLLVQLQLQQRVIDPGTTREIQPFRPHYFLLLRF